MSEVHASMSIPSNRIDGRIPPRLLLSRPLFYFDLAPVLERAGPTMLRNPNRLEIVCDHCVKSVTTTDNAVFVGNGFYLIVTSCDEPLASQLAQKVSAALLKCFFGKAEAPTETLAALFRRPTHEEIARLERTPFPSSDDLAPDAETGEAESEPHEIAEPATANGDELAAEGIHRRGGFRFGFVPVHDFRKGTLPGFFCSTIRLQDGVLAERNETLASLDVAEYPRVDQAMLQHALSFSKRLRDADIVAAVGTRVSFETLAWSKGRQHYQNALREMSGATNPFLIVIVDMVPSGTPPTRLTDLIASIRPHARRVFLQVPDRGLAAVEAAKLGAAGYVISAGPGITRTELVAQSMRLVKICNYQGALSCVEHIPDLKTARLVQSAGVRLGTGNFFDARVFSSATPPEKIRAYKAEHRDTCAPAA